MVDIMTALATAGHVSNLLKELLGIDKAVNAAEFKFKIAELTEAVADLKLSLVETKDDLATKDAEIERLKKSSSERQTWLRFVVTNTTRTRMAYRLGRPIVRFASRRMGCCFTSRTSWARMQAFASPANQDLTLSD